MKLSLNARLPVLSPFPRAAIRAHYCASQSTLPGPRRLASIRQTPAAANVLGFECQRCPWLHTSARSAREWVVLCDCHVVALCSGHILESLAPCVGEPT